MNAFALLSALPKRIGQALSHPSFTCDLCGREIFGGEKLCAKCLSELPAIESRCPRCGREVVGGGFCLDCKYRPPAFDMARSPFSYEGGAAELLLRFKNGQKYLGETLARFMIPMLAAFPDADCLSWVPMTVRAEKKRGYNQAFLLAEKISEASGLPLLEPAVKLRETAEQKTLGERARNVNLRSSFRLKDPKEAEGRHIVIVDDTMTTGSTLGELSKLYRNAGAARVYGLTFTSVPMRLFPERNDPKRRR